MKTWIIIRGRIEKNFIPDAPQPLFIMKAPTMKIAGTRAFGRKRILPWAENEHIFILKKQKDDSAIMVVEVTTCL